MSSFTNLLITSTLSADQMRSVMPVAQKGQSALLYVGNFIRAIASGNQNAALTVDMGSVKASGTITVATTGPTNGQTMTLCGQTLTAKTSGAVASDGEFNISATAATVATGIAAAINAVVALQTICTATSALGVVTVTAISPGAMGNGLYAVNVNLSNTTVVSLAGGSNGTTTVLGNR